MSDEKTWTEPRIQIGDHVLTSAQAMALRVAACNFHAETADEECRQELGRELADLYHARLGEVLTIIINSPHGETGNTEG